MRSALALAGLLGSIAFAPAALAAGGHHSVDDATILAPGQCELESWATRAQAAGRLLHLGGACRAGAVELGLAAEPARQDGERETGYSAQLKWAREFAADWSAGASLTPQWRSGANAGYAGTTASLLLTWTPAAGIALHANAGADRLPGAGTQARHGAAVEWWPEPRLSLSAERYLEQRTHLVRAGARWAASPQWTVDASHAHRLRGPGASTWTLGLTRQFDL